MKELKIVDCPKRLSTAARQLIFATASTTTTSLLLLQLFVGAIIVAEAKPDGIVVRGGVAQPLGLFTSTHELTNHGFKARVESTDAQLHSDTYEVVRHRWHGWVLRNITPLTVLRFNGTLYRGVLSKCGNYAWVDFNDVEVEFFGERRTTSIASPLPPPPSPLPINPQQSQQQQAATHHQYSSYPVDISSGFTQFDDPEFGIAVAFALIPVVEYPGGGLVMAAGSNSLPQMVGHFTWSAKRQRKTRVGSNRSAVVEITAPPSSPTSTQLTSGTYEVRYDLEWGWVLQPKGGKGDTEANEDGKRHILRPNGGLYRKRATAQQQGGAVQVTGQQVHAGTQGVVQSETGEQPEGEILGTYEWDEDKPTHVNVLIIGEKLDERLPGQNILYEVDGAESPPNKWKIIVSFMLEPNVPPDV